MTNKNVQNFSGMLGHPEGRGRATPIFWQELKLLKKATKVGYFSKIAFASSSLWSDKIYQFFQTCWVTLRGVAGPHPFFGKNNVFKNLIESGHFFRNLFASSSIWP